MEVRGYRGGEGRTKYRQLKWTSERYSYDLVLLVVIAVILLMLRTKGVRQMQDINVTISYDGTHLQAIKYSQVSVRFSLKSKKY